MLTCRDIIIIRISSIAIVGYSLIASQLNESTLFYWLIAASQIVATLG